jgi:hypothetical protein
VRADPKRPGLLFCGTETAVYFSIDDGDVWQPLRLNMPATSIRDLVIHDDDLVAATHGRGFWILDDLEPLRQASADWARAGAGPQLCHPAPAFRVRWNTNTDTPLPPDEPAAENPPDGAVIYYFLPGAVSGPVLLEIMDESGKLVRRFSSADESPEPRDEGNIPRYWIRRPRALLAAAGLHRFVWDLHLPAPAVLDPSYPIAAVPGDTPKEPRGPWVLPGGYTVQLSADGHTVRQPLTVKLDPRAHASSAALRAQHELSLRIVRALERDHEALERVRKARAELKARGETGERDAQLAVFEKSETGAPTLTGLNGKFTTALELAQAVDAAPTPALAQAVDQLESQLTELVSRSAKALLP